MDLTSLLFLTLNALLFSFICFLFSLFLIYALCSFFSSKFQHLSAFVFTILSFHVISICCPRFIFDHSIFIFIYVLSSLGSWFTSLSFSCSFFALPCIILFLFLFCLVLFRLFFYSVLYYFVSFLVVASIFSSFSRFFLACLSLCLLIFHYFSLYTSTFSPVFHFPHSSILLILPLWGSFDFHSFLRYLLQISFSCFRSWNICLLSSRQKQTMFIDNHSNYYLHVYLFTFSRTSSYLFVSFACLFICLTLSVPLISFRLLILPRPPPPYLPRFFLCKVSIYSGWEKHLGKHNFLRWLHYDKYITGWCSSSTDT